MAFQLSPGVQVVEKDMTGIVPAVATSIGGYAGAFQWGPVEYITSVSNEGELVKTFGKPNDTVAASFFSAANFLSYSTNLKVVRVTGSAARNANSAGASTVTIKNIDDYEDQFGIAAGGEFAAKYPGKLGNSLGISICDSTAQFATWDYKGYFDSAPSTSAFVGNNGSSDDELHLVVVDILGLWTGTAGEVIEIFSYLSKASDAKKEDGSNNYYVEVLKSSKYIWCKNLPTTMGSNWGTASSTLLDSYTDYSLEVSLTGGVSADAPTSVEVGMDLFVNAEAVDVSLLFNGPNSLLDGKYLIEQIASTRLDCLAFVSPALASVVNPAGDPKTLILTDRNTTINVNTSYGVMDSGWKYQYDKYNDKYRWVPLNADIAGLCARTDNISDPWFSPSGLNRGQIKNVVKLAYSPDKSDRDELYKASVNPVVSFPGEGTVLYGDKTMLTRPSAFDRINVRRLFIVLEKAIATAGKYQLFEFNDSFTRAQFRNLVEPFLRDVKGRRGVYDFRVVCDDTNNTGEVVDRNEFVADIYIKPARSINFITLNFIATRTGVSFEEVVGA